MTIRESQPGQIREGSQRGWMCAEGVSISLDDVDSAWHCQTDRDPNRQEARHVPRAPKEQNLRLRSLLDEAAMSNKGLARRIVDVAAVRGVQNVRCDHTSVLRWLAGEQPRSPVPELAAVVLGDALGRKVSETELGMTPSDLPGDLGLQLPVGWTETTRLLTSGSYQEETGRQLAAACGELSQLAGRRTA